MSSVTMTSRYLDAADLLLRQRPRSSAFRRRAISTAYYAVFHEVAKLCAGALLPDVSRDGPEYARVYRALDHGPLKNAFAQSPLRDHETLRKVGDTVVRLQSERHRADYLPPDAKLFPLEEAKKLVDQARQTLSDLNDLKESDRRILASCLLFKTR